MRAFRTVLHCSLLLTLAVQSAAGQGIITTLAGSQWVFQGNGRPAVSAPLSQIRQIKLSRDGALYVADPGNNMVFRISGDGVLSIVAGNGASGFAGDNGSATQAALQAPVSAVADAAGNLYIADQGNERVRKVSANGTISTIAGTGSYDYNGDNIPANLAALGAPSDVAVDSAGNVYIADPGNNRIRKVSAASGLITTFAGTGADAFSGDGGKASSAALSSPSGIFIDAKDQLYIADSGNRRIRMVDAQGIIHTVAGVSEFVDLQDGIPAIQASLDDPEAVTVDGVGGIYIAEAGRSRIRKVASDGVIRTVAGNGIAGFSDGPDATSANLNMPGGVAVDARGAVFIADTQNSRIRQVAPSGAISTFAGNGGFKFGGDGGPAAAALLNQPGDVVLDRDGNVYVADTGNNRVRKITPSGVISTLAGDGFPRFAGDGGPAVQASLNGPTGLALDSSNNLLIADTRNGRIRKIDAKGTISTVAGGGTRQDNGAPAIQFRLQFPQFLAFDGSGNLYVTDSASFSVHKISPDGNLTIFAGNGEPDSSGDGGPAVSASISYSGGIAVDSAGNVYFTEVYGGKVRRVTADGKISTYAGNGAGCCSGDGGTALQAGVQTGAIAFDKSDNLYTSGGLRVRKVAAGGGTITTVAGGGSPPIGSIGDGGSSLSASLHGAFGVRVDASGNVYVADQLNDRIRLVLSVAPQFQVAPALLSFQAKSSGVPPVDQTLLVTSAVTNLAFTVGTSTTEGRWLRASPAAGLAPGNVQVSADPTDLPPGNYEGVVSVQAPSAVPPLQVVNVKFTVTPADSPSLAVEPAAFAFDFGAGLPGSSRDLLVRNNGAGEIRFTISATTTTGGNWLSVTPGSGAATAIAPSLVKVTASPGDLQPGTYSGLISVQGTESGQRALIPVTMTVHAATPIIVLSDSGFTFYAVAASGAQQQSLQIINPGLGALNWSAASEVLSGDAGWLSVTPATGASGPAATSPGQVVIRVDPSKLAPGDYYGRVTISAVDAANSPQVATVILRVAPTGTPAAPDLRPTGLIFVGLPNGDVAPQTFQVTNLSDVSNSFRSSRSADSGPVFFAHQPTAATLPSGQPVLVSVTPNLSGLTAGVRRGAVTLQYADGSTRSVAILLVIPALAGSGTASPGFAAAPQAACTPTNLNLVFSLLGQQFQIPVSWPAAVEVKIVDDCGNSLDSGRVTASFSNGDPPLSLIPVGSGRWTATWQPSTTPGQVRITVNAEDSTGKLLGTLQTTGVTTANPRVPVITSGSVVNAASLDARTPLAPGSLISIFGQHLATGEIVGGVPRETFLNGTLAALGGVALPLLYVSDGQINALVPYNIPINTSLQLVVQSNNTLTAPVSIPVAPAQPAVFTVDQTGTGQGHIYGLDGRLVDSHSPTKAGDVVVVFCEGLGAVDQPIQPGYPAPSNPVANTANPVTATIGGVPAKVLFAGLTPLYTGLYQVNILVPGGVPAGDKVELVLATAGQFSPPVTLSVR